MTLGYEINWMQILLWLVAGISVSVVLFYALKYLADVFERPVIRLFDKWWKPVYMVGLAPGTRLEVVVSQNKKATVWWDMTVRGIGITALLISIYVLTLAIKPALQTLFFQDNPDSLSRYQVLAFGTLILGISIVLLVTYWILEWIRQNKRLVVFTDETYYTTALPAPLGFLPFVRSERIIGPSSGPTYLLEEMIAASDVEDIGGPKTSSLRDRWTEYLAKQEGAGSISLPSRVMGAQDTVSWISHVRGTAICLRSIAKISDKWMKRSDFMDQAETAALIGRPDDAWTEDDALRRAEEIRERRDVILPETEKQVDLFSVGDPGVWDRVLGKEFKQEVKQDPDKISRIFSKTKQTDNPKREVFEELWKRLSSKLADIIKADFDKEEAHELFLQHDLSPQELAHLIIREGTDKQEILDRYPLEESEA